MSHLWPVGGTHTRLTPRQKVEQLTTDKKGAPRARLEPVGRWALLNPFLPTRGLRRLLQGALCGGVSPTAEALEWHLHGKDPCPPRLGPEREVCTAQAE